MNWRAVFRWTISSLVIWCVLSATAGFLFGLIAPDTLEGNFAVGGMVIPFLILVTYFPQILSIFLFAAIIWGLISMKTSALDTGYYHKYFLAIYSIFVGILFWLFFPADRSITLIGAIIVSLSIFLPRLISSKLIAGTFTGEE
ncbi:MAG: hypothetical protein JEZ00_20965 [Anaerolineaceae bacterium]|nr:hypothetical protein [Anaerolineaceae bacterium]